MILTGANPVIEMYRILRYLSSMKVKTSVTLSALTIKAVDELAGPGMARSRIIEQAVLEFIERRRRRLREQKDLETLNRSAERLNRQMEDILAFQVEP
jgi:metal-responsive CopG/Arc/MetJ family transcriptional regulator